MTLANWIEPAKAEPPKANKVAELPWSEKYRPEKLDQVVGNPSAIGEVRAWASQWKAGKPKKKALLIYGNVGTGKTSLAYALASELDWEILEMNASDKRSQDVVEQIAGFASQTRSFSGKVKAVLVEEIEGLSGTADRGATSALIEVVKNTAAPIIITCNDLENKKLSGLKVHCEQVQLKKVAPGAVVKLLKEILDKEGGKVEDISILQRIADNADGDVRSAINDLQAVAQGKETVKKDSVFLDQRDRPIDTWKAMNRIFRATDYISCRRVIGDLDEEPRNFVTWLDENIPVEYASARERAKAFNNLSRADVFLGRVTNRQYWGFLRYVNDLSTVGVRFVQEKPNFGFAKYSFPSLIWKMGSTRGKRAKQGAVAAKIGPVVHESKRRLINDYIPLVDNVFKKNKTAGEAMVSRFELSEEEAELFG
jgi:replication factor C large subunit